MLALAAGFAAWTAYSYLTIKDEPEPSFLGVALLGLAAVFCVLRARRSV